MKKVILLTLLVVAGTIILWSQVPQAMNYKAVAKDDWGVALPNKTISLRFTILQGSETGAIVYQEAHLTATNKFGLMDVEIGKGTPVIGSFNMIEWSTGVYYIQIEMDPTGGTNFRLEDTAHQLLSVPYALYAGLSGNSVFTETDPVFTSSPSYAIWNSNILNWNTAFSWGDHANEGYLKSFTEFDPIFLLHPAYGIASENISNWNTAFGWGSHSGLYKPLAYVPTWSEITENPFLLTSPEANQLLRFNSVSGKWENWIPDFLTIEVDGSVSNELQSLSQVLDLGNDAGVKNIINLANPINAQDAATKAYVDALEARIAALEVVISGIIIDQDGDGYTVAGGDCDDTDASRNPGATEICGDGIDQDCDGSDLECSSLSIGNFYQGGIVAYILQPGDPGYNADVQHGLIAAPSDLPQSSWCRDFYELEFIEELGTTIGAGATNTLEIISRCCVQVDCNCAALSCFDLELNGYNDWHLPSKDELNMLYINKDMVGGFGFDWWWSSSYIPNSGAWMQHFGDGSQSTTTYVSPERRVRAVRYF